MEAEGKRIRSSNYSLEEKNLLIILVNSKKSILENKKTDAVSNAEKETAWKAIATEFNALSTANIYRDMIALRKMYSNMKKVVRKEIAEEKIEILKTGGGPPCTKVHNPLQQLTMETINQKTVTGLNNLFDSDNISTAADIDLNNSSVGNPTVADETETIYIMGEASPEPNNTWSKWKPENLNLPLSNSLKRKAAEDHGNSSSSRRRPAATTVLNSSNISKLYSDLAEQRLECVLLEKSILENKKKWVEEKYKLKKQMLELELQLKFEELKKNNPD